MIMVKKRDGKLASFDSTRIEKAIKAAAHAANENISASFCKETIEDVVAKSNSENFSVEDIQNIVENHLMEKYPVTAKRFIIYREQRAKDRDNDAKMLSDVREIVEVESGNLLNDNANINGCTPAGQMMKMASLYSKDYALRYLMNPMHAEAHQAGLIHVHDLDYYLTRSLTCCQIDLKKLFKDGFNTNDGAVRQPKRIKSYAALAAIALQANQNEMHGGQSIPAFDYFMADGVRIEFKRQYKKLFSIMRNYNAESFLPESEWYIGNPKLIGDPNKVEDYKYKYVYEEALKETKEQTYQAMESFVFNMVNMHSRGGGQIVFSSINYGTDDSAEGRLVMDSLLDVIDKGTGDGGTFIFPISVFKVKNGINYSEEDYAHFMSNVEDGLAGKLEYKTPNFDLFIKACEVSSRRLFPNFIFLDSPFNQNPLWDKNDPNRYMKECATMGCRTRVFDDIITGEQTSVSRGNLSFTTLNIVRLGIEAKNKYPEDERQRIVYFMNKLDKEARTVCEQLLDRYQFQRKAKGKQFPFLMGQGLWKDGETVAPNEELGDIVDTGSLSLGFIGLAETLVALIGEHHGQSPKAQDLGLKIVGRMRDVCDEYKMMNHLNFTLLATPAEGISGRFTMMDRKRYGVIPGVTDRDFYTNSCHVPVYYHIKMFDKIHIEAPYHALTNAGHIYYGELDGEAKKNIPAFVSIVREMYLSNIGYGAINHPVDRCCKCGFEGVIDAECPKCGEPDKIDRIRRITGYLVGTTDRWNSYKLSELKARVPHSV